MIIEEKQHHHIHFLSDELENQKSQKFKIFSFLEQCEIRHIKGSLVGDRWRFMRQIAIN